MCPFSIVKIDFCLESEIISNLTLTQLLYACPTLSQFYHNGVIVISLAVGDEKVEQGGPRQRESRALRGGSIIRR